MPPTQIDAEVKARLAEIREKSGNSVDFGEIADIVESIISPMNGNSMCDELAVSVETPCSQDISTGVEAQVGETELEAFCDEHEAPAQEGFAMNALSSQVMGAVADIKPERIQNELLPAVTEELAAVVAATDESAHRIMQATEALEDIVEAVGGQEALVLSDAITAIFEACSFQDITGQRITNVGKKLTEIDLVVEGVRAAIGDKDAETRYAELNAQVETEKECSESELLHGPQKSGEGNTQEEIDAILASFD